MNFKFYSTIIYLVLVKDESLATNQSTLRLGGTSASPGSSLFAHITGKESTGRPNEFGFTTSSNGLSNDDLSTDFLLNFTYEEDRSEEKQPKTLFQWSWSTMEWPWWVILQMVSAILGIVGNFLVILVVFWKNSSRRSTDILVGNLALADFLLSIVMIPRPKAQTMPSSVVGRLYCRFIFSPSLQWMLMTVSSYQLVAICFDRYFAVVHPLTFNRMVTKRRVWICTALVWLTFMLAGSRAIFGYYVEDHNGRCVRRRLSVEGDMAFAVYHLCLRIGSPTVFILLTQILIAKKLYREDQHFSKILTEGSVTAGKPSNHLKARTRVLKMMLIVIVVFIICWAPDQIAYFFAKMGFDIARNYLGSPLQRSFVNLTYFNSCVNPFIYTARSPRFRKALKGIFNCSRSSHDPVFGHEVQTSSSQGRNKGRWPGGTRAQNFPVISS
ncbi:allatostatin-A receptor-like [Lytechinus variegatus]|uniref:allatostatin-A receptor-like n=1 Tax=Lytechinus variegatus TaxID=7654 RepID=UPI001BB22940|nr:allatostatin-A receptor-like [Lytechinus variegatus]